MFNKIKKGQKKARKETYGNQPFVPNLVAVGGYCNARCRYKTQNTKNLEEGGMDYGVSICDVCGDTLEKQANHHKRHKGRCLKIHNARANKLSAERRVLKLKEEGLKSGVEICL